MAHPAIAYTLSTILFTITVVVLGVPGSSATRNTSSTTLPAGYVSHPEIGVAYKVYLEMVKWKVARERCISEGAHLAVIDTFLKFESMMTQTSTIDSIWVGIHSMFDDTEWVNANTGSTLTGLPWAPTEPNGGFDCVVARKWENKRGLRNELCSKTFFYVCEVPIPGNENGCKDPMAEISIH